MFVVLTLFGVLFTAYALWIFLCGLGDYSVGFVLNIKLFKLTSALEIGAKVISFITCKSIMITKKGREALRLFVEEN
jgi:hypothetical protein